MTQAQKDAEEAEIKKLMKEKSSAILGQSLVRLTAICMPKCVNIKEGHVDARETKCLQDCVRALHKTHNQVFKHMLEFEQ